MSQIILVGCDQSQYRKRLLDMPNFGMRCLAGAFRRVLSTSAGTYRVACTFADSVPNSYGYPARTSAALAVACVEDDAVVVFGGQLSANKATRSGVAFVCLYGYCYDANDARWLWDRRTDRRDALAWRACIEAYARVWSAVGATPLDGVPRLRTRDVRRLTWGQVA